MAAPITPMNERDTIIIVWTQKLHPQGYYHDDIVQIVLAQCSLIGYSSLASFPKVHIIY